MTLVVGLTFLANAAMMLILLRLSRASVFGQFVGSAVNPLVVFILLLALANIDFLYFFNNPQVPFIERVSFVPSEVTAEAYGLYSLFTAAAVGGMFAAILTYRGDDDSTGVIHSRSERASATLILGATLLVSFASLPLFFRDSPLSVSYQVITRDAPILAVMAWLQPVALALFLATTTSPLSKASITAVGLSILPLIAVGGARVMPLVCILTWVVALHRRARISSWWYLPVTPILALFLAISRYIFREQTASSFSSFLAEQGGLLNLFFGGEEISFGKMFSILYLKRGDLSIPPFQSLAAFLVAPLPRSFFPWKPFGLSALFTEFYSPERWELTKSESLITGFGDLLWQFGPIGGCVVAALLSFMWCKLCILAIHSKYTVIWLPILLWSLYSFLRGDLFNVGLLFWPACFLFCVHLALAHLIGTGLGVASQRYTGYQEFGGRE